ncbi:MAG: 7-cyano-7-deazaguanine synthase QueC [Gemmatimonadetes bacterium]|nr:7-cyano-7-deazaguanine synthase QueC [Gemmatimonadota bacterium]MBT7863840.1 7-cyano-7-deazaguanine synthase QueC [Gemmatimonadota bacterium]
MNHQHAPGAPSLVLLSGGMDSATCLWWIRANTQGPVHTVSIDYGQRHRVELDFASQLSTLAGAASHRQLQVDLNAVGGSPLTDPELSVPAASDHDQIATVVPFRNLLFVTLAAGVAEVEGVSDLYIAPVRDDQVAYRDCRREFYDALETTLGLGATHEADFRIHTPFVDFTKQQVVRQGMELGVPYELTHTCYEGRRPACGVCDACTERRAAFAAVGVDDPISYQECPPS